MDSKRKKFLFDKTLKILVEYKSARKGILKKLKENQCLKR